MAEYAKDVLVTTEWLAEHLNDASVVVAEVDEDPDLYEGGHIVGAVKLHWRDDLQDPLERDLVDREAFERLDGPARHLQREHVVLCGDKNNWFAAFAYWYLKVYRHEDVRVRRHLPAAGGAVGALRVGGHHGGQAGDRLLPHRRAQRPHVVRPQRAAGL